MTTRRAWMISSDGASELPIATAAGGFTQPVIVGADGQLYLVGQSPPSDPAAPSAGPTATTVAVIAGLVGGVLLLSFVAETLPGAMIAHYGFNLGWGQSFGIGVASAVGWNMVSGLLRDVAGAGAVDSAAAPVATTLSPAAPAGGWMAPRAPSLPAWFGSVPAAAS